MNASLFHQMSPETISAVALLLGFSYTEETATGFRNNLGNISPLPEGFTIGQALDAYLVEVVSFRKKKDLDFTRQAAEYLVTGSTVYRFGIHSDEYDICYTENQYGRAVEIAKEWLSAEYFNREFKTCPIVHTKIYLQVRGKKDELIWEDTKEICHAPD